MPVTRSNLRLRHKASTSAGEEVDDISALRRTLVSITTRIGYFLLRLLCARCFSLRTLETGFVDQVAKVVGTNVGEGFADLIDSLTKQAPFNCVLDEFGEGAFFKAASAKVGTQGEVGIFGPHNG